ncbi:winged helix-turn-helix domain-containing protein [Cellulomonas sp. Leaf395]|uniref:winged helix-turn-helix domain-containing protein n=1 Tax=Cellulomonas sp. Leaf395 TaxID=1736362 RepID=UPI000B2709B7|nr:crosslink repair DNA glycosylase YcaQ family protein [Cellulomonas sp. Leaf395]
MTVPGVERLTLSQARRITLRAQGLDRPRPVRAAEPTMRQFQQVVDRLGVLQIDSVNVLARAHLLPVFSRVGAYDPALLDRASGAAPRRLVETWAHMASYVPPETFRLLGWRQRAYLTQAWGAIAEVPLKHSPLVEEIRAIIAARGPVTARQVQEDFEADHPTTRGEWGWNWSVAKRVLEFLFFTGEITSAGRNGAFERRYDLTSRVLPPDVLARPEPSDEDAVRALTEIGARAHGIGTLRCFADYFRIKEDRVAPAIADLVEEGVLHEVEVDGWNRGRVWRHRDADLPRRATGRALLNPFDPLVFERRRLEALFGLRYRIEIYVPEPKRVWGYYVLPFLLGESLPALVDLKADRQAGVLRVHAAHRVTGSTVPDADVVEPLAAELRELAGWLGLDDIVVGDRDGLLRGDLAPDLARAVRSA